MPPLTPMALDFLHGGVCLISFDHERYDIVMLWLTHPKHPGIYPTGEEE